MDEGSPLQSFSSLQSFVSQDGGSITYGEYNFQVPQRVARLAPQVEYRRDQVSAIPRRINMPPPPVPGVASEYPSGYPHGHQQNHPHLFVGEYYNSR